MEDMCQLTERLTEDKYHGSYEQIAKAILKYSATPGLDVVNFFEDFVAAMNIMKVEEKQQQNIFSKMTMALPKWEEQIDQSFMSEAYKKNFKTIVKERMHRIQR